MQNKVWLRALVPSKATQHWWNDSESNLEIGQNEWTFESYALVVTYKVGTHGNIPVTNGLIKACGPMKHLHLTRERMKDKVWLWAHVPSKATRHWWIDSASNLETEQNEWTFEWYALVVTYKGGTLRNIPVANGLIKGWGPTKHSNLKEERKFGWEHLFLQKPHMSDRWTLHPTREQSKTGERLSHTLWSLLTKLVPLETTQVVRGWLKAKAP
jgi:hypothetical protein